MTEFDQCEFGLAISSNFLNSGTNFMLGELGNEDKVSVDDGSAIRIKKATIILSNIPKFSQLSQKCKGQHLHQHAYGSVRLEGRWHKVSKLAGAYPDGLCYRMGALVLASRNIGRR